MFGGRFRRKEEAPKSRRGTRRYRLRKKTGARRLAEYAVILLVAFVLVFGFLRPFVVKTYWIPSESMVPTLEVGDRLFVNKLIYRFTEPERGDIVVLDGLETDDELIKRVVAVSGDRVRVRNGVLRVNGDFPEEPYTVPIVFGDGSDFGPTKLSEGEVFVMGDNRGNSRDSRFFGPVPVENIEGEAFFMFWPPSRIGLI
ncbi:MAG: Signal peptidase I [uncultured Rubrobacteraceae bacterium]|uniref:Signal peptidase I n=1 Tax=uncultured Rubrobacteraceae bacterium TaxID=349277 RepID=A0A6J4PHN4_9ACTN|nr:MAG: Signal peptidase I [uncultured Rubrobacteraceae bacterium]